MGEAIRKVVSERLAREQSLIPGGLVTVNRVDVAKDFSTAWVFYSVFGSDLSEKDLAVAMKEHQAEFRHEISKKLNLRHTPRVEFCFDRNIEYAFKIDSLLK